MKKDKYVYYHCTGNKGKCPEPYAREEVLEQCFADLLKGLAFDDEVMDWVVDALHQSHADQKRFRAEAIARLQAEETKIQNRLDKLYEDRLDGFIEPAFFERKTNEWKHTQRRLAEQIAEHEAANHDYVQDGVRLLELSKKAYFLFKKQNPHEKRRLLDFVCSNSTWKNGSLTATLRQPFDILAVMNTVGKSRRPLERLPATFFQSGSAGRTRTYPSRSSYPHPKGSPNPPRGYNLIDEAKWRILSTKC